MTAFYQAKRTVPGIFDAGDKFVEFPTGHMFLVTAPSEAAYLDRNILNAHGGIHKYFEECAPVPVHAVSAWRQSAENRLKELSVRRDLIDQEIAETLEQIDGFKSLEVWK